jgi:hypothetical protein
MALTLAQVIAAARHRSPWFHPQRGTPDKVVGDYLADYQNELIGAGCLRDKQFLSQTATIALSLGRGDPVTLAGAGADAGLPGAVTDNTIASVPAAAARLVEVGHPRRGWRDDVCSTPGVARHKRDLDVADRGAARARRRRRYRPRRRDHPRHRRRPGALHPLEHASTPGRSPTAPMASSGPRRPTDVGVHLVEPAYARTAHRYRDRDAGDPTARRLPRAVDAVGVPYIDLSAPIVATLDVGVTLPSASGITAAGSATATARPSRSRSSRARSATTTPGPASI